MSNPKPTPTMEERAEDFLSDLADWKGCGCCSSESRGKAVKRVLAFAQAVAAEADAAGYERGHLQAAAVIASFARHYDSCRVYDARDCSCGYTEALAKLAVPEGKS